ncbi:MAG TPA: hypothetical protein VI933_00690 [archaeon]|nr:hypothetical protein [archaeon]
MPNLQKIISAGYLLEPGSEKEIEKLSEQQINFLANLKTKPLILTRKIIEGVANPKIKLIEKVASQKYTVQDFVNAYNQRYSTLRDALAKNSELKNLVSIGSAGDGEISVIGMVKEKTEAGTEILLELEDTSGTIKAKISSNGKAQTILLDEVIGAHGFCSNKILEAKEIFWPDIPLRETKKVESPAIVLIAPTAEILQKNFSQNFNYAICFEPAQIPISKIGFLGLKNSSPTTAEISGLNFLISPESCQKLSEQLMIPEEQILTEFLKRRSLHGSGAVWEQLIENIPDVFVARVSKQSAVENYKGTLLVGLGAGECMLLDLQTREAEILKV